MYLLSPVFAYIVVWFVGFALFWSESGSVGKTVVPNGKMSVVSHEQSNINFLCLLIPVKPQQLTRWHHTKASVPAVWPYLLLRT